MKFIYKEDVLDKASLLFEFNQLLGLENSKPFECVGTIDDVKNALDIIVKKYPNHNPTLINYYKSKICN